MEALRDVPGNPLGSRQSPPDAVVCNSKPGPLTAVVGITLPVWELLHFLVHRQKEPRVSKWSLQPLIQWNPHYVP